MGDPTGNSGIVLGRSIKKPILIATVACALALGIFFATLPILAPAAEAQDQVQDQNVVTVPIRDFFFDPADITVEPGTTVMWVNEGSHTHTVTSDDGQFDSEALMPGDSFMVTFSGSGTLTYHCEIHPDVMRGSVTVSESGGEAAPAGESSTPASGGAMDMSMGSGY
jgi:plastocyanin